MLNKDRALAGKSTMDSERRDQIYQDCIKQLGYEILSPLQLNNRSLYTIKKDEKIQVAKIGSPQFPISADQVQTESKALAAAQGILGVVQKISNHKISQDQVKVYVLIREYVEGANLKEKGVLNKEQQSRLEETVRALHQRGITNLDLYPENVIISVEGISYLFDLGVAKFKRKQGLRDHRIYEREDWLDLQKLFLDYGAPKHY